MSEDVSESQAIVAQLQIIEIGPGPARYWLLHIKGDKTKRKTNLTFSGSNL